MPAFLSLPAGVVEGADGRRRCWWPGTDPLYLNYHDTEWGRPVSNDNRLFEKLCLEGFQSGLSWLTILRKRENFRVAFAGFDFEKVARFGRRDDRALSGGCRHRAPPREDRIGRQQRQAGARAGRQEGSLAAFVWRYEPDPKSPAQAGRAGRHRADLRRVASRCQRSFGSAAGRSLGRRRSTPSCRPWASSTITSTVARAAKKRRRSGVPSCGQNSGGESERRRASRRWRRTFRSDRGNILEA